MLVAERITGSRTLYTFTLEDGDDSIGDVALSYRDDHGLQVVFIPTLADGILHVQIDTFVDGTAVARSGVQVRR